MSSKALQPSNIKWFRPLGNFSGINQPSDPGRTSAEISAGISASVLELVVARGRSLVESCARASGGAAKQAAHMSAKPLEPWQDENKSKEANWWSTSRHVPQQRCKSGGERSKAASVGVGSKANEELKVTAAHQPWVCLLAPKHDRAMRPSRSPRATYSPTRTQLSQGRCHSTDAAS
jgi:hypothetical protein